MILEKLGNQGFPNLLFLYGFMGEAADWQYFREDLSRDFCCLSANFSAENVTSLSSLSWKLKESLETLVTSRRYRIVGYSMGGRLALRYALEFPDSVDCLVIASASPGIEDLTERQIRAIEDDQRAEILETKGIEYFLEYWYGNSLFDSLRNHSQIYTDLIKRRSRVNPTKTSEILRNLSPGREPSMWQQLPNLKCPILLLAGSLDLKYIGILQKVKDILPQATLKILPNVGHAMHIEKPELFLETIRDFLITQGPQ